MARCNQGVWIELKKATADKNAPWYMSYTTPVSFMRYDENEGKHKLIFKFNGWACGHWCYFEDTDTFLIEFDAKGKQANYKKHVLRKHVALDHFELQEIEDEYYQDKIPFWEATLHHTKPKDRKIILQMVQLP